jgi:tetratricopeptide (TPR) repeat protein
LPTLNPNALNPGDFLHGRYTYLPLAGLLILIATIWHLAPRNRLPLLAVAGLIAATFSVLTLKQEKAWENDLSVFTVAHEIAPHNGPVAQGLARAHVQVALALDEAGECDQAVPMFEQAIQQYPQDWFAWAGLGECLFKLNDLPGAERSLHRAADLSHEPKVKEEWEQIREKMGFPPPA